MSRFSISRPGKGGGRRRINREPSPMIAGSVPWISIGVASFLPSLLFITSAPVIPPFGFLMFIAWRQLRPGLLPVWAGLPLGLFDDLYSGQPFGSGVMLWCIVAIVLDIVEARLPWRNFLTEWLVACGLIAAYIALCLALANVSGAATSLQTIVPQIVLSIFVYPLVGRIVALSDRFRLTPFREIS